MASPNLTIKFHWTSESTWCHDPSNTWFISRVLSHAGSGLPAPAIPTLGSLTIVWDLSMHYQDNRLMVGVCNTGVTYDTWQEGVMRVAEAAVCDTRLLPLLVNCHGDNSGSIRTIAKKRLRDGILL